MSVKTEVTGLIETIKKLDPRIYQALTLLNNQVDVLTREVEPLVLQSTLSGGGTVAIPSPSAFTATSTGTTVRLQWAVAAGASSYEVRKAANPAVLDWDTASLLFRTNNLQADIDPVLYGNHRFLLKSLDNSGNYSASLSNVLFNVPQIPAVSISPQVIDNNVLLRWTVPVSTFHIRYYIIERSGAQVGISTSTFAVLFETVAGTFTYSITAVDIAGNIGTEATVDVLVNTPPDFALQDSRISALNGTRENAFRDPLIPSLIVPVNLC